MDIVYNLKKFFIEQQDEAAIPGLGVFYKSETDINGKPLPKGDFLIMFKEKTPRSNAFANFLGYEENLIESEALSLLEQWVGGILDDLKRKGKAKIPELGIFDISNGKVTFIPDEKGKSTQAEKKQRDEYGLDAATDNKVKQPKTKKVEVKKQPKIKEEKSKNPEEHFHISPWLIVAAALILLIGTGIACYKTIPNFRFFTDKTAYNVTHGKLFGGEKAEPIVIEALEVPIDNEKIAEAAEAEITETEDLNSDAGTESVDEFIIKENQERLTETKSNADFSLYVVGGSFAVKANAEKFQKKLIADGFDSKVIFDNNKQLHLVTLSGFNDMDKAITFRDEIRSSKIKDCWIYKK